MRRFDFLQQGLEPTETRYIPADPEEFDATEGTETAMLLAVPNVHEDTGKRCDADTGTDENGHFRVGRVFCWSTIGTINTNDGQGM